jgi:hypothetical protein
MMRLPTVSCTRGSLVIAMFPNNNNSKIYFIIISNEKVRIIIIINIIKIKSSYDISFDYSFAVILSRFDLCILDENLNSQWLSNSNLCFCL